jgi:hypothetical protein
MFLNSNTIKTFAVAASIAMLPVAAHAEEKTFVKDGVTYTYTETVQNDRTVLTGMVNGKTPFHLTVKGGRVSGEYNYKPTEFSLRDVKSRSEGLALR